VRRALFLDRDGVINVDRGYVCTQNQFEFVEGVFDLCRYAKVSGYLVIVVTNQAGIGRGYYSEQDFAELTNWMCARFQDRGAPISKVYHCAFHPEHGIGIYKLASNDRKPGPGMILRAAADFGIDLKQSVLIGDKETDIQAGVAAGVGCNLLYVEGATLCQPEAATAATFTIRKLCDAAPYLTKQELTHAR
jgi:D-glycero-D-manno-heptose 1,7-bisphosphate phosphatase